MSPNASTGAPAHVDAIATTPSGKQVRHHMSEQEAKGALKRGTSAARFPSHDLRHHRLPPPIKTRTAMNFFGPTIR